MKRSKLQALVLSLGLLAGCQPQKDDPEILKKILADYFEGIRTQDLQKLDSLTTEDFVLFEDGRIWTNDSLVKPIPNVSSLQGSWTFDSMRVNMDVHSGDLIYYNHGEFLINDTLTVQINWLESASFQKVKGQWKMNFLHSSVRK